MCARFPGQSAAAVPRLGVALGLTPRAAVLPCPHGGSASRRACPACPPILLARAWQISGIAAVSSCSWSCSSSSSVSSGDCCRCNVIVSRESNDGPSRRSGPMNPQRNTSRSISNEFEQLGVKAAGELPVLGLPRPPAAADSLLNLHTRSARRCREPSHRRTRSGSSHARYTRCAAAGISAAADRMLVLDSMPVFTNLLLLSYETIRLVTVAHERICVKTVVWLVRAVFLVDGQPRVHHLLLHVLHAGTRPLVSRSSTLL